MIVTFLMVLLSVFLFTVRTKNKISNVLFACYLLVIAFDLTGFFTDVFMQYPLTKNLKLTSSLLQLPLFFLYVLSACFNNFKLKTKHLLHGIPFAVFIIIFGLTAFSDRSLLLYNILGELQFFVYIIATFIILKRYKTIYLENYANSNYATYNWLFQITLLSCFAHSFVTVRSFLSNSEYREHVIFLNVIISLIVLGVAIFFVLKALYQPDLFTGVNSNIHPIKAFKEEPLKKDEIENEHLHLLTAVMEKEKPYLDEELTLQKLAKQLEIPERELSILINQSLGKHFFDFVNEYRIKHAKKLLKDSTKKELTVQQILYEVGFNSKSSFYTAFKKSTQQTPSAYRKNGEI
ncbi:MAG: AraC family transcriptional regulator [Flavobacteriaceae bacterium]|nr:AraC family transcriptional regulator [Flavobacteriaceae bacterium]